ncbi:hypothetical protein GF323_06600 [Candidatus Woesearchaeota archaeon]|nr:hypothetical protein [Candidatus Woesearchaeota archaeon]
MEKIGFWIIFLLLIVVSYASVLEVENDTEKFLVTMINQEPDPVAPGNTVNVRFRIENKRTEPQKNVEVKLETKYPFSLYWSEGKIKNIGTLAAGQDGDIGVRVKYRLLVDKNAAEGNNEIEFWYRVNGGAWVKAEDFMIEVREKDAVLAINEISSNPEKMLPGKEAEVSFNLENMATSVLKDIKLKLELFTTVGTTTTELPFTPIGSGNEKTISKIDSRKSEEVDFKLFVDSDAESKVYKVPYTLTYSDEIGTNFTRSGYLGLMIDAEPDVSINIDNTDIYSAGAKGTIDIRIVNKGFSDVKFVDLVLSETENFEILSNPEVYIGNIDSDDYESAEYTLLVNGRATEEVNLPLNVEYRNSNGKFYSEDINLKLELFSGKELQQRTNGGGNSSVGIIVIIVILVVGIFVWRRWKKRKKNKQT